MDKDPEYARRIAEKVNRYFETDYNTNKAIDPTFPKDRMSQVVCITEKGEIGYHQTVCEGPSAKDNDDVVLDNEMKNQFLFVTLQNSETAVKQILQEQAAQTAQQRLIYNYLYGIYGTNENDKNREIASYQGEQL